MCMHWNRTTMLVSLSYFVLFFKTIINRQFLQQQKINAIQFSSNMFGILWPRFHNGDIKTDFGLSLHQSHFYSINILPS